MKKALQTLRLRAPTSLPDRTAGGRSGEARGNGSRDRLAQLRVLDSLGDRRGLEPILLRGLERARSRLRSRLRRRLRYRTGDETDPFDARARSDLLGAVLELEGPDRVRRVDEERPVPTDPRRPRVPRDRL